MNRSKKILLSFCIPTYEQPQAVNTLLSTLCKDFDARIEIIIRDDSASNETEKIVANYRPFLPMKYIRGNKEGLDRAIIDLTKESVGKFIWWFGDDILEPGAIRKILYLISSYPNLSFIWVNSCAIKNNKMLTWKNDNCFFFKTKDEILSLDIGLLGFISATLINSKLAHQTLGRAEAFVGSAFVCMYIVLGVISEGTSWYYFGEPLFSSHPKPAGEVRWYNQFQVFGINLCKVVCEFKSKFNSKKIKLALSRNLSLVMRAVLIERALGLTTGFAERSPKVFPLLKLYYSYSVFWRYVLLLFLPSKALKICYISYIGLRKLTVKKLFNKMGGV